LSYDCHANNHAVQRNKAGAIIKDEILYSDADAQQQTSDYKSALSGVVAVLGRVGGCSAGGAEGFEIAAGWPPSGPPQAKALDIF